MARGSGSPTGWLRALDAFIGTTGALSTGADALSDIPANWFENKLKTEAIRGGLGRADQTYLDRKAEATNNYGSNDAEIGTNEVAQQRNVNDWYQDYVARGGAEHQARVANQDAINLVNPWADRIWADAENLRQQGGQLMDQYRQQTDDAKQQVKDFRQLYSDNRSDLIANADITGQQRRDDAMLNEVRNIKGGQMTSAAVGGILAEKQSMLDALDPTAPDYQRQKAAIETKYHRQARDTVTGVESQITAMLGNLHTTMSANMTTLKSNLNASLTTLSSDMMTGVNKGLELVGQSLDASKSVLTDVFGLAGTLTAEGLTQVGQLARDGLSVMWDAIQSDEKAHAFATVDAPNAIMDSASLRRTQNNNAYTSMLMSALDSKDQWLSAVATMSMNFGAARTHMSDYFRTAQGLVEGSFGSSLSYDQYHQAAAFHSDQMELAWGTLGIGGIGNANDWANTGIAAADVFGRNKSPNRGVSSGDASIGEGLMAGT